MEFVPALSRGDEMRAGIALDDIGKINALDLAFRADGDRLPPKGQLAGRPLSEDAR